jgi:hypothetical protein
MVRRRGATVAFGGFILLLAFGLWLTSPSATAPVVVRRASRWPFIRLTRRAGL